MQTRNNYDKDIYNGDIGFIRAMDVIEHTLAWISKDAPCTYRMERSRRADPGLRRLGP